MDPSQAATALLTEHLQYTPLSLIDDVIDSVNNFVYQGVGSLETGLFATPPERLGFKNTPRDDSNGNSTQPEAEYPEAKQEIEEGLHKLETLLNSTVDKNFDKFEIYVLRNVLSVPHDLVNWIRLSHYEGIQHPLPADAPTPASIALLRQKLAASRQLNKALQTEQRRGEVVLAQVKQVVGSVVDTPPLPTFSFLHNSSNLQAFATNQSQQPLTTSTTFTASQLPALKSAVTELRTQLAALRKDRPNAMSAKDEVREERMEYIEQRTQRHLQRNGQTIIEDAGAVGDRTTDPSEIDALEKVAAILNQT